MNIFVHEKRVDPALKGVVIKPSGKSSYYWVWVKPTSYQQIVSDLFPSWEDAHNNALDNFGVKVKMQADFTELNSHFRKFSPVVEGNVFLFPAFEHRKVMLVVHADSYNEAIEKLEAGNSIYIEPDSPNIEGCHDFERALTFDAHDIENIREEIVSWIGEDDADNNFVRETVAEAAQCGLK